MNWFFGYGDWIDYRRAVPQAAVRRLIVAFIVVTIPLVFHTPIWAVVAALGLCYWRDWLHRTHHPIPSVLIRLLLAMVFVGGAWVSIGEAVGREAGTVMVIGLTGIKFLELTTVRDYMVLAFVLYLLLMLSLLFEQSIPVFIYVLVAFGYVTNILYRLNMDDHRPYRGREMVRRVGGLFIQALPLALVLFLVFPRVHGSFGFDLGLARTGLSKTMSPGDVSNLVRDNSVAFRAEFPNGERPAAKTLYWRALVHTAFDTISGQWSDDPDAKFAERAAGGMPISQRLTVYPHGKSWLFGLDPVDPTTVSQPEGMAITATGGKFLTLQSVRNRPLVRKTQYDLISRLGGRSKLIDSDDEPYVRRHATRVPNQERLDPGVIELAKSLRGDGRTDEEVMEEALFHFRKQKFIYTTRPPVYRREPTSEFLLEGKRGFCEHFASAFAVLMRLNDIPARVITGYQGGEYNPYGNFYVVRQADAHAWVEVYFADKGWVRVDPTIMVSPGRIIQGAEEVFRAQNPNAGLTVGGVEVLPSEWKPLWLDATMNESELRIQQMEEIWDRWVLSYNKGYQLDLVRSAGFENAPMVAFAFLLSVGLFITLALAWLSIRLKETRREPLTAVYAEYNLLLARAGVEREPWEGPLQYAARAAERLPHAGEAIQDFGEAYARVRYGPAGADESGVARLRFHVKRIRAALKGRGVRQGASVGS